MWVGGNYPEETKGADKITRYKKLSMQNESLDGICRS